MSRITLTRIAEHEYHAQFDGQLVGTVVRTERETLTRNPHARSPSFGWMPGIESRWVAYNVDGEWLGEFQSRLTAIRTLIESGCCASTKLAA